MGLLKNSDKIRRPYNWNDLTGKKYGKFTVIKFSHVKQRVSVWLCKCECGNERLLTSNQITTLRLQSCGCLRRVSKNDEYGIWNGIIGRCQKSNHPFYKYYGGRGISVCEQWNPPGYVGFVCFLKDMGKRPSSKHSIDRIDTNGNYCPENCRWTTSKIQGFNKRKFKKNKSGRTGVYFISKKWIASIRSNGKQIHLGCFSLKTDAIKARELAEIEIYGHAHKYQ